MNNVNLVSRFHNFECEEREVLLQALATDIKSVEYGMNPNNSYHDTLHKLFVEIPDPAQDTLAEKIEFYLGDNETAMQYVSDMHAELLQEEPKSWVIATYDTDRACGGAEEGGWYYNCGTIDTDVPFLHFTDEEMAIAVVEAMNKKLPNGRGARMYDGSVPPARFPETRPHYE